MNRTLPVTDASQSDLLCPNDQHDWLGRRELSTIGAPDMSGVAHCFFAPIHYESGYEYPLIVWMHGDGSHEEELWQLMPQLSVRNYVAVAPRGTQDRTGLGGGFGWGDSADELAEASERTRQCIELARQRYTIHPNRTFIAGYAEGGTMAQRIGMENPDLFAGAISLGGPVPRGGCPLRNINQARHLPLLLAVSPNANNYSSEEVLDDLKLLHYAGFSLSLRLYPEGDGLTTTMLSDVNDWVMESLSPTTTTASD
ncbi:MAG: hypothetical protein MK171_09705 [Pirellulales bacterium]|nr:hypothetical protein [Pirellulales bacterium]